MAAEKAEILLIGAAKPVILGGLEPSFVVHKLIEAKEPEAYLKDIAPRIRGIAIAYTSNKIDGAFMSRFPKLEIVSSFGVGYDHVDAKWAGGHGIIVTNTPEVLKALGPNGVLINMARGSVVDEPALIQALKDRTILSAGLDVFVNEPRVPQELIDMDHIVLFPHLGSASAATRKAMDQLVVDNLKAWFSGKLPLTPVPETPVAARKSA